jgi:formate-dependent nitrite reductase membrane component NrfD
MEPVAFVVMEAGLGMSMFCSLCALVSEKRRLRAAGDTEGVAHEAAGLTVALGGAATALTGFAADAISSVPQMANLANIHPAAAIGSAVAAGVAAAVGGALVGDRSAFSGLRPQKAAKPL